MTVKLLFSALTLGPLSVTFLTGCGGSGSSGQSSAARTTESLPTPPSTEETVAFEQHLQLPLTPGQQIQLAHQTELRVSVTELSGRVGEPLYQVTATSTEATPRLDLWLSSTSSEIQLYRYRFSSDTNDTGIVILSLPLRLTRSAGAENVQRVSLGEMANGAALELRYSLNFIENQWLTGEWSKPLPADRIALSLRTGPVDGAAASPEVAAPVTIELALTNGLGITALTASQNAASLGGQWQSRWGGPDPVWLSQTDTGELAFATSSDWTATNTDGSQAPLTYTDWILSWQPPALDWLLISTDQVTARYRMVIMADSAALPTAGAYPLVFTDENGNATTTSVIVLPDETNPTME